MGRRREGPRVLGPYKDARGWKYKVVEGGTCTWVRCRAETEEAEAQAEVEGARAAVAGQPAPVTVADAVESFRAHLVRVGHKDVSARFYGFIAAPLLARCDDLPIEALKVRHVEQYLDALISEGRALATARSYWSALCRMVAWWRRQRWLEVDPCEALTERRTANDEPFAWQTRKGRLAIGRGKPQLRGMDEVLKYLTVAGQQVDAEVRVATTLPLRTGIASGELLHLTVGAVDFTGGLVWIRDDEGGEDGWSVKTASRRRAVELPPALVTDLRLLCAGRGPTDLLFVQPASCGARPGRPGTPRSATWLRKHVQEVCRLAGVRVVPPHGLRDTHASVLRALHRKTAAEIGDALGHADHGATARRHYIGAPDVVPSLEPEAAADRQEGLRVFR